ncbi:MAG TPA: DUF4180 domain-containing protein [Mucilaginibacter sp.]
MLLKDLINDLSLLNMEFKEIDGMGIITIEADELLIKTAEDGIDLLGNIYYQGYDKVIISKVQIIPDFFELKNGMAGEILQKFSNFRVRLVIIGDFSQTGSKSLDDFIRESNKGKLINFLFTKEEAINRLSS